MLRAGLIAFLVTVAAPARAQSLVDVVGGIALPVADDNWTKNVDPSPKLGVRAGATGQMFGGLLSADWTPEKSGSSAIGGLASSSYSFNRFRILAHAIVVHHVAPKIIVEGRIGVGIDLTNLSASSMVLGNTFSTSDTNVGFAFEAGGGVWFDLGSIDLGGLLSLPVGTHSQHSHDNVTYQGYTAIDVDLLLGVRFRR
jgi:hypothetical protein